MSRIAVVGAGVTGASIAYHLAARGHRDIRVIDRGASPGAGSTSRATGGFRLQFSTAPNIRLSLLSLEKLLQFRDETGVDPGYTPHGYLFIATATQELDVLREAHALQHSLGAKSEILSPSGVRKINPAIADAPVAGGSFGACDGFIRPMDILRGYTEAAERLGVRFLWNEDGVRFRTHDGKVTAIETRSGIHEADVFVNAAGAWAGLLSDIPVQPLPRHVAATVPTDRLPSSMPMTIWTADGFHLRVRDGRVLLLRSHETPSRFDASFDEGWLADVVRRAHERIPALRDVPIDRPHCWSGLYEMSPDRHVLLGMAPLYANLFVAAGSSGHGVMHSPAIGQLAAEMIDGAVPSVDIAPLSPSRFAEGKAIASPELL